METNQERKGLPHWPPREPREYARPIADIMRDLATPPHPAHLKEKVVQGNRLTFCPWYHTCNYLDTLAPGWSSEIRSTTIVASSDGLDRIVLVVRITIPAAEGVFHREASGTETLVREKKGTGELKEIAFGDPSSNAEGMALRRAAAKWGFCRHLYYKK